MNKQIFICVQFIKNSGVKKDYRMVFSQIPCKIFARQCFFTGHMKFRTVNKITCRMPSANPY